MDTDFRDAMSKRTDEELVKIVTVDRNDYQPLAVAAAEEEVKRRNLDLTSVEQIKNELIVKIEKVKQTDNSTVSSWTRLIHFLLDSVVWIIIAFILTFISTFSLNAWDGLQLLAGFVILLAVYLGYHYVMELRFQKTVAKFVTKTKVVTNNGNRPGKGDILMRTLGRLIPFDQISFLFIRNGFHDMISGTRVIREDSK
ncbi:MAG: RDD family protein [Tannerella sp.]|jgi:uncharacterized RDD family membrane protein YckC|nr:RDD family protein [Tannerella sp.]